MSYAAPIWSLRHLDVSRIDAAPANRGPGAIREGVAYVRARPDLLLVLSLVFFAGTFGLNFQITSALMATEVFDKGPEEFGLLGTFLAIGSLTGSLLAARRPAGAPPAGRRRRARLRRSTVMLAGPDADVPRRSRCSPRSPGSPR